MIGNRELRDALAVKLRLHRDRVRRVEEEAQLAMPDSPEDKHASWRLICWHLGQLAATREIASWVKDLGH